MYAEIGERVLDGWNVCLKERAKAKSSTRAVDLVQVIVVAWRHNHRRNDRVSVANALALVEDRQEGNVEGFPAFGQANHHILLAVLA